MAHNHVIFASFGNDSIALIQWVKNCTHIKAEDVTVIYSDTGWMAESWKQRIIDGVNYCERLGFTVLFTRSEGMESLVKRKKGWPMGGGGAFCTQELKVLPALNLLDVIDPQKDATCYVGIRREESANRAAFPRHTESSEKHGGRELDAPLVQYTEEMRNRLIQQAGFEVLPHRSKECSPCVHANKHDLLALKEPEILRVERIEKEMGINSKGNPRVLFRPKRHKGAIGIRAVIEWARGKQGKLNLEGGCDSGYCGG